MGGHVLNYRILTLYQLRCFGVKAHGLLNHSEVHVYLSPVELHRFCPAWSLLETAFMNALWLPGADTGFGGRGPNDPCACVREILRCHVHFHPF